MRDTLKKMSVPLGSPTLAATAAQLRNRIPTQLRRLLPVYLIGIFLILIMLNLDLFSPSRSRTASGGFLRSSSGNGEPPKMHSEFPKKIWQIWKVHPLAFDDRDLDTARSWMYYGPDYRYEVLTDDNALAYVEWHYGPEGFNRPDIVDFYRSIKAAIVKADLLRYLVMYAEGGIYADIDVEALKPLWKFIPERYNERDIDMVIGVEIDEPDWKDHPILGSKSRSFCQWVFICKPHLPVMMRLVEQIMAWLARIAKEQNASISDVHLDFDEIISGTGPSAFTEAILAEMNAVNKGSRAITWDHFHDLDESKIVSRVLVLTVEAFAAGQGHSNSGNHGARAALVKHHYHASGWPSRHPRYRHPVYGEVERCNWDDDCINEWDENVAAFKKLSKADQKRLIEEKEKEEREEEEREAREEERERKKQEQEDAEEEAAREEEEVVEEE